MQLIVSLLQFWVHCGGGGITCWVGSSWSGLIMLACGTCRPSRTCHVARFVRWSSVPSLILTWFMSLVRTTLWLTHCCEGLIWLLCWTQCSRGLFCCSGYVCRSSRQQELHGKLSLAWHARVITVSASVMGLSAVS